MVPDLDVVTEPKVSVSEKNAAHSVDPMTLHLAFESPATAGDAEFTTHDTALVMPLHSRATAAYDKPSFIGRTKKKLESALQIVIKFGKFVGPGFLISVAYMDPGNYATDVAAGASHQYKLLFVVLMSNLFAVFLQSQCVKLGTVSGSNLAELCRLHLPRWMNIALYIIAEAAIIATDVAEVIGTAIAINLLIPKIPLVAGCAISILDVFFILLLYRPDGSMKGIRIFEFLVVALVLGVVICFCFELSLLGPQGISAGEVFKGYLPSPTVVSGTGIYQSCGILGATVMPHSLYLGTGIVQARVKDYDRQNGTLKITVDEKHKREIYYPTPAAVRYCLNFSLIDLILSLFTFALFVNSAILIVAGAKLSSQPDAAESDLFQIHDLLSTTLAPAAGTVFALALLFSGLSSGVITTIAGQMLSEGAFNFKIKPWIRRLVTRSISIIPSIVIAGSVGRSGLSAALNASQVALSVCLPFLVPPIIYFLARESCTTVKFFDQKSSADKKDRMISPSTCTEASVEAALTQTENAVTTKTPATSIEFNTPAMASRRSLVPEQSTIMEAHMAQGDSPQKEMDVIVMKNHWSVTALGTSIWLVISIMNVALLVILGLGNDT